MTTGRGALFAIAASAPHAAIPIRLDPPSTVTRGQPLTFGGRRPTMLAVAGLAPWVATRAGELAQLDSSSLAPTLTREIAPRIIGLASSPDALWVATSHCIYRLDPADGATRTSYAMPSRVMRFGVSPDGSRFYVALGRPVRHDAHPVLEFDAATGAVVTRTFAGYAELRGPRELLPTSAGVWITTPTGMMGSGLFYRASDLHQRGIGAVDGRRLIEGTNGIWLSFADGVLWETLGDGGLACVEPSTAKTKGHVYVKHHSLGDDVVAIGDQVWASADHAIDLLRPPDACGAN
jgi:hypothetical protein